MNRLLSDGAYFSDAAMRTRQPLLYHQLLGQYLPPPMPSRMDTLSDSILSQADELQARHQLEEAQQQQRREQAGQVSEQETESEEESESESEAEDNARAALGALHGTHTVVSGNRQGQRASVEGQDKHGEQDSSHQLSQQELQDAREELLAIMQQRFLAGQDNSSVDYHAIDHDDQLGLDDDNAAEVERDAMERHFDAGD